ncbi:MAG: hypothetical protein IPM68_03285 [Flavobacteriales bacterium]|nr:hypothetical protein [Flavobacteriales bacterium]
MDQGSRIGSIGLMMLLAMPGAQAQLPMDIVWQHAPWTFESGPNTISSALGVGLAPQYTRWTHHGTPSPQNLSTCSSLAYEQDVRFDPWGFRPCSAVNCRLDEVTWAFLGGGGSVWSDMINTTNYIFVNGAYLPCSDSLWTGQFFRGLTERNQMTAHSWGG